MKKTLLCICIGIFLLSTFVYLQFGRQPSLNHSTNNQNGSNYDLSLSITLNRIFLLDKTSTEKALIQQIESNTFPGVLFSYDILGKPQTVTCTVYTNTLTHKLGIPAFQFKYTRN